MMNLYVLIGFVLIHLNLVNAQLTCSRDNNPVETFNSQLVGESNNYKENYCPSELRNQRAVNFLWNNCPKTWNSVVYDARNTVRVASSTIRALKLTASQYSCYAQSVQDYTVTKSRSVEVSVSGTLEGSLGKEGVKN